MRLRIARGRADHRVRGYCCKLARLLLEHGVRPVIVFDGNSLGAKGETAAARAEGRRKACAELDRNIEEHRELQMRLEQAPHDTDLQYAVGAAKQLCDKAAQSTIKVTKEMVVAVMTALKGLGCEVLRAPYEADAQLAYLARKSAVYAVLTEDSDLVAYACPRVLLKLDRHSGVCQQLLFEDVPSISAGPGQWSLKGFDEKMFLELCVLCGCDYLEGLKNLGPKTAIKLMSRFKDAKKVIRHLRQNKPNNISVPSEYADKFANALITFRHQRVWSSAQRQLVHLTEPIPEDFEGDVDAICGAAMEASEAGKWVHAAAEVPRDDPFSKSLPPLVPEPAQPLPNPLQQQRRGRNNNGGSPKRTRKSPSKRNRSPGGRSPGPGGPHQVQSQMCDEAEALLMDSGGGGKRRSTTVRPPPKFEQFDDDDDEEGKWEEMVLRSADRPKFEFTGRVPPAPSQTLFDEEMEMEEKRGGAGNSSKRPMFASAADMYNAMDHGNDDNDDDNVYEYNNGTAVAGSAGRAYGGGYEDDDDAFHEPTVEELVDYANGDDAPLPPPHGSPDRRKPVLGHALKASPLVASRSPLRLSQGATEAQPSVYASQPMRAPGDGMPVNPFAGARKVADWVEQGQNKPPGVGRIDAANPYGTLSHGKAELDNVVAAQRNKRPGSSPAANKRPRWAATQQDEADGGEEEAPRSSGGVSSATRRATRAARQAEEDAMYARDLQQRYDAEPEIAPRGGSGFSSTAAPRNKGTPGTATQTHAKAGKKTKAKVPASKTKISKAAPAAKQQKGMTSFFGKA